MKPKPGSLKRDTKNWKILSKIDQEKKQENIQVIRKRNERGTSLLNLTEVKRIIKEYSKQLYASKLDNLDEIGK